MAAIKEKLRRRIKSHLPGVEAQKKMAPKLGSLDRFKISDQTINKSGAVLILLYYHKDILHIPLMVRTEYDGPHSGQISLPGGKKETIDADLTSTALRESHEEMGIISKRVEVLGELTELSIIPSNFSVLPIVGFTSERPDFKLEPREVKEIIEVPMEHLLHPDNKKEKSIRLRDGIILQAPYYDVFGHTVWGATAMILCEFLTVFEDL